MQNSDELKPFQSNDNMQHNKLPFYYCVNANKLFAGEYPTWFNAASTLERIHTLLNLRITTFIDLTEAGEEDSYYDLLAEEARKIGSEIDYKRIAIKDRTVSTVSFLSNILDIIDKAIAANKVVYVHCQAGIGRTGTVIGCYLVRHGMSGEEALDEILRLRNGMRGGLLASPHMLEQREMILNWTKGK